MTTQEVPEAKPRGPMQRLTGLCVRYVERFMPDPYLFAVILTVHGFHRVDAGIVVVDRAGGWLAVVVLLLLGFSVIAFLIGFGVFGAAVLIAPHVI